MSNVYEAPESNLVNETQDTGDYGSIEKALAGEYKFSIGETLSEAWDKTSGAKWPFNLAIFYYMIVMIGLMVVMAIAVASTTSVETPGSMPVLLEIGIQVGFNLIMLPMGLGLMMMGIKRSVGGPLHASEVFSYFPKMIKLFLTMLLMSLMVLIGLMLLVIPGIYLMVAYYMAMPLVVEKNMSPWQALELSRKTLTHRWFAVFFLFIILGFIVTLSMIPLGIGAIWTIPMAIIAYGIMYRNMFGVEASTLANN